MAPSGRVSSTVARAAEPGSPLGAARPRSHSESGDAEQDACDEADGDHEVRAEFAPLAIDELDHDVFGRSLVNEQALELHRLHRDRLWRATRGVDQVAQRVPRNR